MSVKIDKMIYLRDNRVYITPNLKEYDVTNHIQELIVKLKEISRK
ncbi:hypothetical protein [Streptococcus suis]|nr:hypothetical protein [Streptococcus suis]QGJ85866.1 hypothetical protein [Streptococcus phage phi-SsuFJZZ32_rum]QGJ85945.1 hypothetical protein [Streptococcus phage phi-SsuFJZZ39_rum]